MRIHVPDVSAATTDRMIVKYVIPFSHHRKALNSLICADVPLRNYSLTQYVIPTYGILKEIQSDKARAFTSALFTHINKFLGIRHVTSAALTPKSNGLAETIVKRLVEHLKFYCEDDYEVNKILL